MSSNDENQKNTFFNQSGQTFNGPTEIKNVAGNYSQAGRDINNAGRDINQAGENINFSSEGTLEEFKSEIERLKEFLSNSAELGKAKKKGIESDLEIVIAETEEEKPSKSNIVERLELVKNSLEGTKDATETGIDLVKTLVKFGTWAATLFV